MSSWNNTTTTAQKKKYFINDTQINNNINNNISSNNNKYIKYISGGRLGDLIFQLCVINANYLKTGKKGILYIADIGDKFIKGLDITYNDTEEFILKQNYIESYHIYNNEDYDINLSSWRDNIINNKLNWIQLFNYKYNINFGIDKWINNIPINNDLKNKILVSHSLQRENTNINLKDLLIKYDTSNLIFICLDENEYINFINIIGLKIPCLYCKNLMEIFISINSCELFIGNFSAPLCIALSQHKKCIGIAPTNPLHGMDWVLIKDMQKYWPYFTVIY